MSMKIIDESQRLMGQVASYDESRFSRSLARLTISGVCGAF
eukprot:COSAG05_NODE_22800_length_262_cov_0.638037_1_plen_40_part_10